MDDGTEPPLSRFAGEAPKPRPTYTLVIPTFELTTAVIDALLYAGEIFTVEPSPTQPDVWHVGVFATGASLAQAVVLSAPSRQT